jgi:hypothetical protein
MGSALGWGTGQDKTRRPPPLMTVPAEHSVSLCTCVLHVAPIQHSTGNSGKRRTALVARRGRVVAVRERTVHCDGHADRTDQ